MNTRLCFAMLTLFQCLYSSEIERVDLTQEVVDKEHNLVWEDKKQNATDKMSFKSAVGYCHSLALNDKQDWRLPTQAELLSIVDTLRTPSVNTAFKHCADDGYWIQNKTKNTKQVEWIDFADGNWYEGSGFERRLYTRCVHNR